MRELLLRAAPEWVVAGFLLVDTLILRWYLHAPLRAPTVSQLFLIGEISLVPMIGVSLWIILPLLTDPQKTPRALLYKLGQQSSDVLCFVIVLLLHFQIKLWVPLIHSTCYDAFLESTDRIFFSWLNPLIAWRSHWPQNGWINGLYFNLFFLMFLVSFFIHNLRSRSEFRRVFFAIILMFAFGANLYILTPALGPFLYQPSANDAIAVTQHIFYRIRQDEIAGGLAWLRINSGNYLTSGLAAMPSLHSAAAFILLYYMWRWVRPMVWIYGPVFIWILFAAMASRWHYGLDLIAGVVLACCCIALSNRWMKAHEAMVRG